jgi:hypothetical protein
MTKCTVVTCFYAIPSKQPKETYLAWANHFMKVNACVILFTSNEYQPLFANMRGSLPIEIIVQPFEELYMWKKYELDWKTHKLLDKEEYHSPELYALWANKVKFVEEAIQRNPFHTEFFYWCDIGAFRSEPTTAMISNFPLLRFPKHKLLLASIHPRIHTDIAYENPCMGVFSDKNRLIGGLFGGDAHACLRWSQAYEDMLLLYFQKGQFAGKDQSVMLSTYLKDPSLAEVVRSTVADIDNWFFTEYLLSDANVQYVIDTTYHV